MTRECNAVFYYIVDWIFLYFLLFTWPQAHILFVICIVFLKKIKSFIADENVNLKKVAKEVKQAKKRGEKTTMKKHASTQKNEWQSKVTRWRERVSDWERGRVREREKLKGREKEKERKTIRECEWKREREREKVKGRNEEKQRKTMKECEWERERERKKDIKKKRVSGRVREWNQGVAYVLVMNLSNVAKICIS